MTVDVAAQGAALIQAVLLGLAAGVLYDLFRILRVRVRLPLLGPALDLLFWLMLTGTLFLWSQWAWGGPVRLYGVVFLFFGGVLYFLLFSRWMLWIGYRLADLISAILKILALPLTALGRLQKKIKKLAKNIFLFAEKWYRINQITQEMESTARRRADREKGGASNASETRGTVDKIGRRGAFGVSGHLSAGSAGSDPIRTGGAGDAGTAGGGTAAGQPAAGRRHRKQRRP